jgi:hypothetical protein
MANATQVYNDFQKVFATWETELDRYSMAQLAIVPPSGGWTMGQLYLHLINATLDFHLQQVTACASSSENRWAFKNINGFMVYNVIGGFPKIQIKVPPSETYTPPQPASKAEIVAQFAIVKAEMQRILVLLQGDKIENGKTRHPGLRFLNANEWYKLVEMHWRHHQAQKARLDAIIGF